MKTAIILMLAFPVFISAQAQTAPATTPAARAWLQNLEARKERFDQITVTLKKITEAQGSSARISRSLFCPLAFESALTAALTSAHFVNAKNEDFHLIFNAPGKQNYLDVSYTYNEHGVLVVTSIRRLPDGWSIGLQPGGAGRFIVITDDATGCLYEFDSRDPFASQAFAAQDH